MAVAIAAIVGDFDIVSRLMEFFTSKVEDGSNHQQLATFASQSGASPSTAFELLPPQVARPLHRTTNDADYRCASI
jgi:hypothetical protein